MVCIYCSDPIKDHAKQNRSITGDACPECIDNIFAQEFDVLMSYLDNIEAPVLLIQPGPGHVRIANKKACDLLGKDLSRIEGYKSGQVFGCVHSFTEAGCEEGERCDECEINNSVTETFASGKSFAGVSAVLNIRKNDSVQPYNVQISTERVRDVALVRIERYEAVG